MADIDTVKKVADLAALSIEENELEEYARDLDAIIGYMEQLSLIDTGNIAPMEHIVSVTNAFREDEVTNTDRREDLLKSAAVTKNNYYIVPNVVEQI
ncbi:MAG: Asp-tRNA(Asn)/Glu-tRNA(Gln) amidotransferase subunit GatC [Clostridiaceae bacterium]|nr:Asp-tRNA(Asn)/Glu-tRNA(Gln) amidotransferase subunit GatC [Clostridiaceae bacterium]